MQKTGKWENLLIIDEPIWDSVQSNRRGLCPNISTTKWRACPCCSTATSSNSPLVSLFFIQPRAHIKNSHQHSRLTSSLMKSAAECTYTQHCEQWKFFAVETRNLNKRTIFCGDREKNKGPQGVCRLGSWRLIECLEDKLGDIRYPSG